MVEALLDSAVVVDLLRGYPPALKWYSTQNALGICRLVWMETIRGAENKPKQQIALKLLGEFELVEFTTEDIIWASQQLLAYKLKYNTDPFDCMIASVNHRLQVPLYTRNLKHFTPLIGTLAQAPY